MAHIASPENRNTDKGFAELKVRVPNEIAEEIRRLARQNNRSVNGEIVTALGAHIRNNTPKPARTSSLFVDSGREQGDLVFFPSDRPERMIEAELARKYALVARDARILALAIKGAPTDSIAGDLKIEEQLVRERLMLLCARFDVKLTAKQEFSLRKNGFTPALRRWWNETQGPRITSLVE